MKDFDGDKLIQLYLVHWFVPCVQTDFTMFRRYFYHGKSQINIKGILRYSFLIPTRPHPTNKKASIIRTRNHSTYSSDMHCSD